jgi:hypothetical protein
VLLAQAFVGRDEQDVVYRCAVVVQELVVVQVEDERLAAAGRHPVGQFGQVVFGEGFVLRFTWPTTGFAFVHKGVQVGQQLRFIVEEAVEVDFRVQCSQILEVAQCDAFRAAVVDFLQVQTDVVVARQILGRGF